MAVKPSERVRVVSNKQSLFERPVNVMITYVGLMIPYLYVVAIVGSKNC